MPRMRIRPWLMATRPKTLAAGVIPVLVGAACVADMSAFALLVAGTCLAGAILIQIGCNFANDAYDSLHGADRPDRLGPTRAVAAGLISPKIMLAATFLTLGLAFALGCWLAWLAGWPILVLGVASVISAVIYTGGPYPLAYHGLGDVFVLIFFGFGAVLGTAWCCHMAGNSAATLPPPLILHMPLGWWLLAAAVGLQATAILVVNNIRDRNTDAEAGKRTLAVRWGRTASIVYYACLHLLASAAIVGAAWALRRPGLFAAAALAALAGILLTRGLQRHDGAALNPYLAKTAAAELVTGIAISVGLII